MNEPIHPEGSYWGFRVVALLTLSLGISFAIRKEWRVHQLETEQQRAVYQIVPFALGTPYVVFDPTASRPPEFIKKVRPLYCE